MYPIAYNTCLGCEYLSICHGGCPVRTYSITGDFFVKAPYCQVYKAIFSTMEEIAAKPAPHRRSLSLHALRGHVVHAFRLFDQNQYRERQRAHFTLSRAR